MRQPLKLVVASLLALSLCVGCGSTAPTAPTEPDPADTTAAEEEVVVTTPPAKFTAADIPALPTADMLETPTTEGDQLDDAQLEEVRSMSRDYRPPARPSLFVNRAEHYYYREHLDKDARRVYDSLVDLNNDPLNDKDMLTVKLSKFYKPEELDILFNRAVFAVWNDHPEFFWLYYNLEGWYTYSYYRGGGEELFVGLSDPYYNYDREMVAFNRAVQRFFWDIDTSQSDASVALQIHDKLADMVTYDYASCEREDSYLAHTAFGALVYNDQGENFRAVCDGYSLAYEYLLQQAGIQAIVIDGLAGSWEGVGGHAWNLVQLDGEWYEVDVTWDDCADPYECADYWNVNDPGSWIIPYFRWAGDDSSFRFRSRHYLYNITSSQMADFDPSDRCTYYFDDGAWVSTAGASIHIRRDEEDYVDYQPHTDVIALAPQAYGTRYAYGAL